MHDGKAYLLGAFGELRCVSVSDGSTVWQRDLPREFHAKLATWGMCATPLLVDDLLILNPGGADASLVALECATGKTRWATPGAPAAYAAFICGEFGGRRIRWPRVGGMMHGSVRTTTPGTPGVCSR